MLKLDVKSRFKNVVDSALGRDSKDPDSDAAKEARDVVDEMFAVIEKKEVIAAILELRVRKEIARVVWGALAVFGLSAGAVLYYLTAVLPDQAVKQATLILDKSLESDLADLNKKKAQIKQIQKDIDRQADSVKAVADDFSAKKGIFVNAATQVQQAEVEYANELQALSSQKDLLITKLGTLKSQLEAAEPQINTLNDEQIRNAIGTLAGLGPDQLKALANWSPEGSLLLTSGKCESPWIRAEKGDLLIVSSDSNGKSSPSTSSKGESNLRLVAGNLPSTNLINVTASPADAPPRGNRRQATPSWPVKGTFGSDDPTPIGKLIPVSVCKLPSTSKPPTPKRKVSH